MFFSLFPIAALQLHNVFSGAIMELRGFISKDGSQSSLRMIYRERGNNVYFHLFPVLPISERILVEQSVTVCELSFQSIWTIWCHLHRTSQRERFSQRCPQGSDNDCSETTSVPLRWWWRGWRLFRGSCDTHYWHICFVFVCCVFLVGRKRCQTAHEITIF